MDTHDRAYEQAQVPGRELGGKLRGLLDDGNVRRVTIRDERGNTIVEIPLSTATVGAIATPVLVAVDALSGALAHFSVMVERTDRRARAAGAPSESTGATEDQMNTRQMVAQRIDRHGTKIEDLAGTGEQDTQGG